MSSGQTSCRLTQHSHGYCTCRQLVGLTKEKQISSHARSCRKGDAYRIGISEMCETRRPTSWIGYMVFLARGLGRQPQDDRDSYASKRLDLAGPLMANLFRALLFGCRFAKAGLTSGWHWSTPDQ
jgi:DNA-directed RNA polymerase beta subunit